MSGMSSKSPVKLYSLNPGDRFRVLGDNHKVLELVSLNAGSASVRPASGYGRIDTFTDGESGEAVAIERRRVVTISLNTLVLEEEEEEDGTANN